MERSYRTATGTVTAHDQGAHLAEWCIGDVPVIWVSRSSEYAEGRPIRGGVPVCWPWFGPGRGGDLSPAHGFARIAPWRLVDETANDDAVQLVWELTSRDIADVDGAALFPHVFRARLEVHVEEAATITFTVFNEDRVAFDYEAALHTYLHVGDIRQVRIAGLDGARFYDKVLREDRTQEGDVEFGGETDRIYTSGDTVRVQDPVLDRDLLIDKVGSPHTVVWTPWDAKAAAMTDFADDEWPLMVCVEAAVVGDRAVFLEPGAAHSLSTTVRVSPHGGS